MGRTYILTFFLSFFSSFPLLRVSVKIEYLHANTHANMQVSKKRFTGWLVVWVCVCAFEGKERKGKEGKDRLEYGICCLFICLSRER